MPQHRKLERAVALSKFTGFALVNRRLAPVSSLLPGRAARRPLAAPLHAMAGERNSILWFRKVRLLRRKAVHAVCRGARVVRAGRGGSRSSFQSRVKRVAAMQLEVVGPLHCVEARTLCPRSLFEATPCLPIQSCHDALPHPQRHQRKTQGLRLHDNPALLAAAQGAQSLYPIFIIDPHFLQQNQYK